jgi:rhamnose utilization protein RhaD (predicted bifunctional aldolase and dehydrogenase)
VTRWDPSVVPGDLVALTRSLGEPQKDLVIVAEGNTSYRLSETEIVVKGSGVKMAEANSDDFVVCEFGALIDLMDDPSTDQATITAALDAGQHGGAHRRGSIETLVHAAVQSLQRTTWVAHTHPTAAVALLSSVHAATAFDQFVYSDEAVVIGSALFVPYAQPGIDLGRAVLAALRGYHSQHGNLPSLVLMGNHGIVALSDTAEGAEAISLMATKACRVRLDAIAAGGVVPLPAESTAKFLTRPDIVERRGQLSGQ